ncbi:PREDICTED: uncharacterized protein LOC103339459 [Prunus mume]|uniref:Uncharacterized protein LOC103339459 n=1 Tax=Prunus mume TaxID=102107 RepID=A0ABM1LVT8_PRUMU|nr:PREDICTED: uncharacterized protein LOC103339459 [Prunus mume]
MTEQGLEVTACNGFGESPGEEQNAQRGQMLQNAYALVGSTAVNTRKREKHHKSLMEDYFYERPLYPPVDFRRRFRMRRELFYRILNDVVAHEPYFTQKIEACGRQIVYGQWHLRSPNPTYLYRLLHKASRRGFPSMLGSLDCMYWEWKNCPTAWAGQFTGYKHKPTVVLEAVASYDTWIWHAFFGIAGSNNDINVLAHSPLFNDVVNEVSPHIQYVVNGNEYNMGYYLAQWAIVRGAARMWRKEQLHSIMMTYIILHNMIVEDEYEDLDAESDDEDNCPRTSRRARARLAYELEPTIMYDINRDRRTISDYMVRHNRVRASQVHHNLRNDLINYIWRCEGDGH